MESKPVDGKVWYERDPEEIKYTFVPDDVTVIWASDLASMASEWGVRYAAQVYNTSPSTVSRFLQKNGYVSRRRGYERRAESDAGT